MIYSILFVLAFALYFTIKVEMPPIMARYKALDAELRNICPIVVTRQTFLDELWSGRENASRVGSPVTGDPPSTQPL